MLFRSAARWVHALDAESAAVPARNRTRLGADPTQTAPARRRQPGDGLCLPADEPRAQCEQPAARARPGAGSASTKTASRLWKTATAPALIGVSLLSAVQNYASFSTVFGFTPVYAKELGATSSELGTLTALSLVPFAIAQPLTAGINARFGSRAVVVGGLLTIGLSAIATPACTTMVALLAVQVVAGFGRGVTGTTLMGLSIRHVASEERATAMGVYQAVYAIGMFLGPLVGGAVGDAAGLGAIFFSTGALQLGATIVAWRILNQRS